MPGRTANSTTSTSCARPSAAATLGARERDRRGARHDAALRAAVPADGGPREGRARRAGGRRRPLRRRLARAARRGPRRALPVLPPARPLLAVGGRPRHESQDRATEEHPPAQLRRLRVGAPAQRHRAHRLRDAVAGPGGEVGGRERHRVRPPPRPLHAPDARARDEGRPDAPLLENGRLRALDDANVRDLAARHGDPDELLAESWTPPLPGITVEGSYEEYARDPAAYVYGLVAATSASAS